MKPTSVMPTLMALESLAAASFYAFHGEWLKTAYWLGAVLINGVWIWM